MGPRIVTWNVNGIRNPFSYEPWRSKRTFASMFDLLEADIVVFQETKIQRKDLRDDMVLVPGWDCYFSLPRREKGKFGVVIYTRQSTCAPIRAEEGLTGTLSTPGTDTPFCELPEDKQIGGYPTTVQAIQAPDAPDIAANFELLDSEGRCVILEFPAFVLFGVYAPATRDESRAPFKTAYMNLLDARIRNLVRLGKRVVLTGDLNVSKAPIDVANIEADLRKQGTSVDEYFSTATRRMFNHLVHGGNVSGAKDEGREQQVLWDVCRSFHPERQGMFTHWETKINARPANYGSRIDYILCSLEMTEWFSESDIQEGLHGSDHCPVYAVMKDMICVDGKDVHTLDVMNPPGLYSNGKRLRPHAQKDILPLSGRMIGDFTGRQSIKAMFARNPNAKQAESRGSKSPEKKNPATIGSTQRPDDLPPDVTEDTTSFTTVDDDDGKTSQASSFSTIGDVNKKTVTNTTTPVKRSVPEKSAGTRPLKKTKSNTGSSTTAASPIKGQSHISGFFKPKSVKPPEPDIVSESSETRDDDATTPLLLEPSTDKTPLETGGTTLDEEIEEQAEAKKREKGDGATGNSGQNNTSFGDQTLEPLNLDPARDLEESREGWAKLFSKPQIPKCEHSEPCKLMLSKKQGPNYMRSFYMCARPLGPSGDKERNTQWRCRTFVWQK